MIIKERITLKSVLLDVILLFIGISYFIIGESIAADAPKVNAVKDSTFMGKSYDELIKLGDYKGHALKFANTQFSPSIEESSSIGDLEAGEPIEIRATRGIRESMIIPIYEADGGVVFIAIYRKYGSVNYSLGAMSDVREYGWLRYPPTTVDEAMRILQEALPEAVISGSPILSFYSDAYNPHYEFPILQEGKEQYTYVDTHAAKLNEGPPYIHVESEDNEHPFLRNEDGTVYVNPDSLTPSELRFWNKEAAEMNVWIRKGLLVIDKNMDVLEDARPDSAF